MKLNVGDLVKSKLRNEEYPLFLMVLHDDNPSILQFNAVVIKDTTDDFNSGEISNVWNTDRFELCTWDDIKTFL